MFGNLSPPPHCSSNQEVSRADGAVQLYSEFIILRALHFLSSQTTSTRNKEQLD